jgi:hypothetical protein
MFSNSQVRSTRRDVCLQKKLKWVKIIRLKKLYKKKKSIYIRVSQVRYVWFYNTKSDQIGLKLTLSYPIDGLGEGKTRLHLIISGRNCRVRADLMNKPSYKE